ncbi:hypothetical protein P43SY_000618 [Pythium insidiosum]|uniref:Glutathione S-transferase n=1 Tax=Pythium insidiosum TaxID=114742 RepID=A0AAD5LJZ4_PYTIN|nr:hypothetical protein P43SY_000618 [Pythium insidiosum]
MAHRLQYFPLRSRGELIRLMYAYGGLPLEEVTIPLGRAYASIKPTLPFAQLPVMEIEGKRYAQSVAIARYAAKRVGLYPLDDHLAALEVDMIVDAVQDIVNPIIKGYFLERDAALREKNVMKLNKYRLPEVLGGIQTRVPSDATPDRPYFLGQKMSLADVAVFDVIENYLIPEKDVFPIDFTEAYPKLLDIVERVKREPAIASHLKNPANKRPHKPSL